MASKQDALYRFAAQALFVIWLPVMIVPGAYLLGAHVAGLPTLAATDAEAEAAIQRSRAASESGAWIVRHVIYGPCGCSRTILDHLVRRGPEPGFSERVVLVDADDDAARRAEAAGFQVERLTASELSARYRLEASPILAIADATGALRYLGGYTDHKRSARVLDTEIADAVRRGERVEALPTLGCAVSERLRELSDPIGLR